MRGVAGFKEEIIKSKHKLNQASSWFVLKGPQTYFKETLHEDLLFSKVALILLRKQYRKLSELTTFLKLEENDDISHNIDQIKVSKVPV